jgi:hypothetical protein
MRIADTGKGMAFSCFIKFVIAKSANREMKDAENSL